MSNAVQANTIMPVGTIVSSGAPITIWPPNAIAKRIRNTIAQGRRRQFLVFMRCLWLMVCGGQMRTILPALRLSVAARFQAADEPHHAERGGQRQRTIRGPI